MSAATEVGAWVGQGIQGVQGLITLPQDARYRSPTAPNKSRWQPPFFFLVKKRTRSQQATNEGGLVKRGMGCR
ncbi:hypothetical protein Galf_1439 [Gallionella capsiferriformans ES-2]|uniref:Uncharacterized protein n=1 Tax=Gallionella capsiferriformans (strain ES-2) TaxID=395494 RepID=D9SG12_GALCS|nr:hypothetical protein Galf_1439 [Gallionella capsiferriformans ES-2]